MNGSSGLCWYLPCTVRMSGKFTAAARMRTRACPAAGGGSVTSSNRRVPMSSAIARQRRPSRRSLVGSSRDMRQRADPAQEQRGRRNWRPLRDRAVSRSTMRSAISNATPTIDAIRKSASTGGNTPSCDRLLDVLAQLLEAGDDFGRVDATRVVSAL